MTSVACEWEAVLCKAPVFQPEDIVVGAVSFETMAHRVSVNVPIQQWQAFGREVTIPRYQTMARSIEPKRFQFQKIRLQGQQAGVLKTRVKDMPSSMWRLPFYKNAIPAHRFDRETKERFRSTLAKKAQTVPANIQIRLVFDRMNMTLFENMEQDKQGKLMCHPKSRYIGKNWARYHHEADRQPMYLVFGAVMNTGKSVSALVSAL